MQKFLSLPAFIGTKVIGAEPMTKGQFQIVFERSHPDNSPVEAEGYHVQYLNPNGSTYDSWSPKNVFDEAYRSLDGGLTFGDALFFLKQGKKVARKGWNGKGMYLVLRVAGVTWSGDDLSTFPECVKPVPENMKSIEGITGVAELLPTICMKTADNKILTGWLASQTDMLCEDWCIVE